MGFVARPLHVDKWYDFWHCGSLFALVRFMFAGFPRGSAGFINKTTCH